MKLVYCFMKCLDFRIRCFINFCLYSEKAPGQRECAAALETLNKQLRELDQVAIQAVGQELQPRQANTLQGTDKLNRYYFTSILSSKK